MRLDTARAAGERGGAAAEGGLRFVVLAWAAAVGCAPEWAEPAASTAELEDQLDAMITHHTRAFGYEPAVAVAVVSEGEEVARVVRGERPPGSGEPFASDHPVPLASATKAITALLVMRAVEEGRFALSDRVGSVVVDLPAGFGDLTIEMLLTHTDGLADGHENAALDALGDDERDALSFAAYVELAAALEPRFEPGEDARYGQTGFVLLAMVLEASYGVPYEQHLQETLLDPLGMTSTGFANANVPFQGYTSVVYEPDGKGWAEIPALRYPRADVATAALVTSLDDLVALQGAVQRGEIVGEAVLAQLMADHEATGDWGLGWSRDERRGYPLAGHSGGQSTMITFAEGGRSGAILLSDSSHGRLIDLGFDAGFKAAQWGEGP